MAGLKKLVKEKKCNQCKNIVRTRLKLLYINLRSWAKINRKETKSLGLRIDSLKLRRK